MDEEIHLDELVQSWYQSAIHIMDVRRIHLKAAGSSRGSYRFPASGFLFASKGSATINLDDEEYSFKEFFVLHGGKGSTLKIDLSDDSFEYYLVLYKAVAANVPLKKEQRSGVKRNPFELQFGFVPLLPLVLQQKLERLEERWNDRGASAKLSKLQAKALFYEFVYELLRQLHEEGVSVPREEPVIQAIRFIHEHYTEPLTLERIADVLRCSERHLTRLFKDRTGFSPIDYVIRLRIDKAKELLLGTEATLQEISTAVGYPDVYFFSRMFKKYTGLAPTQYKADLYSSRSRPDPPLIPSGFSIDSRKCSPYTVNDDDNHYQYENEGAFPMNRNTKYSFSLLLLLSFSIMVSACFNPTNSSVSNGSPSSAPDNASDQPAQERVLRDALGNEVKVPAEPERVIATYLEDHLVALGVKPVAQWSVKEGNVQDYLQGALEGIPTIPFDLPYEAVMSFQPDLIIVDSAEMVAGDKYAQYAKIAPTYAVGSEENIDWRQELLAVGEVLNKSEEARQALDNYDRKAAEAKEKLQQAVGQQSAAALWVTAKSVFLVNENLSSGDVMYHDLGLTVPEVVKEISATGSANWNNISMEKLAELDADHLFIVNSRGISKEEIVNDPVWKGIPAVKKGQVYEYDMKASWLYTGTIANEQIIDNVLDSLLQ